MSDPTPVTSPGPAAGRPSRAPRHRAAARVPVRTLLAPLVALALVALAGARGLGGPRRPGDGALTTPAYALLGGDPAPGALSPEGLGAVHAAVAASLTRAFARHETLAGAQRELLWVVLVVSAVLLWRTARRLGVPDGATAGGVLVFGAIAVATGLSTRGTPAALAVPWLLAAALLLARGRLPRAATAGAVLAAVLAVLLAPDSLLLIGAAAAAALAGDDHGRRPRWQRTVLLVAVPLLAGVRLLLPTWASEPAEPDWSGAAPVLLSVAFLVVAALAGWLLPGFRPVAAALAVLTLLSVAPPTGRLAGAVLGLPVAALLLAALTAAAAERLAERAAPRGRVLPAVGTAVLLLLVVPAVAGLVTAPDGDLGARADAGLVGWARDQLPAGTTLHTDRELAAELLHAGGDPTRLTTAARSVPGEGAGTVLRVVRGAGDGHVVARFPGDGDPGLSVTDPLPDRVGPVQQQARQDLAAALLAGVAPVPGEVAAVLDAGEVDPRLLTLLAGISSRFGLGLADLPPVPGEVPGMPVRQAVISSVGGSPVPADGAATAQLQAWLDAQREPFAPDRVARVDGGVLVTYRLVADPDGLVSPAGGG
ncbi:hypothetical protein [Modestobacter marinus]|uniref:hypothetical protein n=1 Tax=Modestobacter marinus TaxID=477641 RepID=UPI001C93EA65|nr:hypothetical protein [Modestobacter marinus]